MDVCSFAAGEPDFDTPAFIREAVKAALDQGKTRYGAAAGERVLREAIAAKLQQDNGLDYDPDQILVTNGCKQALYNLMQVLVNPGDEVLIPAPHWVSYPEMVRLAGGVPVFLPTDRTTGHSTSNVCTFAQYGALAALQGPQEELHRMRQVFDQRRQRMGEWLRRIPGLVAAEPQGTFYLWVDIRATGLASTQFCQQVLEQQQVALVPGRAFGDDQHVRLSYATDQATIDKGMARLAEYVAQITPLSVGEGRT
jgi:aspartate/methionine/tyrosine aminotransferase